MPTVLSWLPVVCACIAIAATIYRGVLKWQEVKTLREIRDRMNEPR